MLELVTRGFELVTSEFEHVTRGFELLTCGFELVTRALLFHLTFYCFPEKVLLESSFMFT